MDDDQSSGSLDDETRPPVRVVPEHRDEQTFMSSGEDGDDEFEEDREDNVKAAGRQSVGGQANMDDAWEEIED
jgi:hypothetical protein